MFEHSEKPPRKYKAAANILRRLRTEGGSLNRIVAELHHRRYDVKSIYSLLVGTLKLEKSLDDFIDNVRLRKTEERLDPWLAKVLFAELILGQKELPGTSKPVLTVKQYYDQHKVHLDGLKLKLEEDVIIKKGQKPRYVRVNTLLLSIADAVRNFRARKWNLVRCTSGSYDDYLKQLENLGEYDFIPDYHVKVVFAFPPKAAFSDYLMYNSGEIFLQDKATCLAGHLLAPTPGSTILDLCAAPGMKTTHLASIIKNEGTIYSVEQDENRCNTLLTFLETSKATCVKVLNKDALSVTKTDCPDVDFVLVDPSCSGSGMDRVANNDAEYDVQSGRLQKLSAFQAKLLRHVLNEFRTAKRIVYSTCSLYPQENEEVVADVLKNHKGKYKLVSAVDKLNNQWNNTGDLKYYEIGEKCLYARPDSDYTCGFFIAIFERPDDEPLSVDIEETVSKNGIDLESIDYEYFVRDDVKNKKRNIIHDEELEIVEIIDDGNQVEDIEIKKKRIIILDEELEIVEIIDGSNQVEEIKIKKKININHDEELETVEIIDGSNQVEEIKIKKKKKKNHDEELQIKENIDGSNQVEELKIKKKKKKHVKLDEEVQIENLDDNKEVKVKKNKKPKKNKSEELETVLNNEVSEVAKKDKKKSKNATDLTFENTEDVAKGEKIKKRKHKDCVIEEDLDTSNVKKLKKKKNTDGENVIEMESKSLNAEVVIAKKKKKIGN